jgi:protein gp37
MSNLISKTKIETCDYTWNPVVGCRNKCPYCYARAMAKRFWKKRYMEECNYHFNLHPDWVWTGDHLSGLKDFKPTWLESQFNKKFPKKPQRIFVGSMSEIYYWDKVWIQKVIDKTKQYPQHIFMFLTKYPDTYSGWLFPRNCWLGVTITGIRELSDYHLKFYHRYIKKENIKFLSLEPLLGKIPLDLLQFFESKLGNYRCRNREEKREGYPQKRMDRVNG